MTELERIVQDRSVKMMTGPGDMLDKAAKANYEFFKSRSVEILEGENYGEFYVYGVRFWYRCAEDVKEKTNLIIEVQDLVIAKLDSRLPDYVVSIKTGYDYAKIMGFAELDDMVQRSKLGNLQKVSTLDTIPEFKDVEARWGEFMPRKDIGIKTMGLQRDNFLIKNTLLKDEWAVLLAKLSRQANG